MIAHDLIELLNESDELDYIEAKSAREVGKSILETICAFSNATGIGKGYILAGVERHMISTSEYTYEPIGITDTDQWQQDLASRCANEFNRPVRPTISVELVGGKQVIVVEVAELARSAKPLFFKAQGLPRGAWIRVGSTDQRCTEDDLEAFYERRDRFDRIAVDYTSIQDVDPVALNRYRRLRGNVRPTAEELTYDDEELLTALNCMVPDGTGRLTVTGVLMFGTTKILRREFPAQRVDYIRVPGNRWMEDPENRFTSIDMRGPLMLMAYRATDAVFDDLPKAFRLEGRNLQAESVGLPDQALREAVVNALMHRSYRVHSPLQLIRYDNRVEITNAGFSLKPESSLGQPGSVLRNPSIADIFHDTNLAETKGTGIRAMRQLLQKAHLAPPTYESNRSNNTFTIRLLLHHFLGRADLEWLATFEEFQLNDAQKQALIFVREVGAIDNSTYRQLSARSAKLARIDLENLCNKSLITKKGKTRGTYYIPGEQLKTRVRTSQIGNEASHISPEASQIGNEASYISGKKQPVVDLSIKEKILQDFSSNLHRRVQALGPRVSERRELIRLILDICSVTEWTLDELSTLLKRNRKGLFDNYLSPLIDSGQLEYKYPDMKRHPQQAYRTVQD